jgi:HK97 gp10 family phage protein
MQRNITYEKPEVDGNIVKLNILSNAEYSSFVEYGTSRQRAQPFIRPAIESSLPTLVEDIKEYLRSNL